ncbi:MAG TPA: hypothetical protein DCQ08_00085 [Amoebophilaceae bacterium]|nr:hypothetical protein [Amoebophilaceae bacterium]
MRLLQKYLQITLAEGYAVKLSIAIPTESINAKTMPRMPIKTSHPLSYTSYYVQKRKTKRLFLKQISQLMHW